LKLYWGKYILNDKLNILVLYILNDKLNILVFEFYIFVQL